MTKKDVLEACKRMKKLAQKNMDDPLFVELYESAIEVEEALNDPGFDEDEPGNAKALDNVVMMATIIETLCQDQLDSDDDK